MSTIVRICIVLILIAVQPFLWSMIKQRSVQLHSNQTNQNQFVLLSKKLAQLKKDFDSSQPRLEELAQSFPSASTISQVVGRIEALADAKYLVSALKSIEDGVPIEAGKSKITTKRVVIEITGSVEALLSFLETVEHQKEVVSVESWDLSIAPQSAPSGTSVGASAPVFKIIVHTIYYFYDVETQK